MIDFEVYVASIENDRKEVIDSFVVFIGTWYLIIWRNARIFALGSQVYTASFHPQLYVQWGGQYFTGKFT